MTFAGYVEKLSRIYFYSLVLLIEFVGRNLHSSNNYENSQVNTNA